ncbi:MAG: TonB-dependent receptor [Gammaproteobacteria bacterium AqS3]|nr:TonB-dependent receptor [Gammaproteobacteria bacterium AqS3]
MGTTDNYTARPGLRAVVLFGVLSLGLSAHAQEPPPDNLSQPADDIEEIIVTGSHIKTAPLDAAAPVSTLSREDLDNQGSLSMVEMIQKLEFSTGNAIGQSNKYQNFFSEGIATVNLRGLGANRTLVLINGQRQVASPFRRGFVDINQIPAQALQRVEILKEGASATYGSDAVAGVVNFITDKRYEGFEVFSSFQDIDRSEGGDRQYGFKFGRRIGATNAMLTMNFRDRTRLKTQYRDWVLNDFNQGLGYSSIGNPGALMGMRGRGSERVDGIRESTAGGAGGGLEGAIRDPGCELLAGPTAVLGANGREERCAFQYTITDSLIHPEEHSNAFLEITHDFADGAEMGISLLYAKTDVPEIVTSPSFPPQELFGNVQYVPSFHPGLTDSMKAALRSAETDDGANEGVANFVFSEGGVFWGRIIGVAGIPETVGRVAQRNYETLRLKASWTGQLSSGVTLSASLVSAEQKGQWGDYDELIANTALAFRGFGGPDCGASAHLNSRGQIIVTDKDGRVVESGAQGTTQEHYNAANTEGCHWYNPFSNAVRYSHVTGAVNPNYDSSVSNDQALLDWMVRYSITENETQLNVAEVIVSGESDVALAGGNISWASGVQIRQFSEEYRPDEWSDLSRTPCAYSWNGKAFVDVIGGPGSEIQVKDRRNNTPNADMINLSDTQSNCSSASGPSSFLAASSPYSVSQDIAAVFGEVQLPISPEFDIQAAMRLEDYGETGNSIDPKIALRYSPTEWFTARFSAASTFRGPLPYESSNSKFTALAYIGSTGSFKAVDTLGNPEIDPERAQNYNLGMVLQGERSEFSIDSWVVSIDGPITTEQYDNWIVASYIDAYDALGISEDDTPTEKKNKAQNLKTAAAEQIFCSTPDGARRASDLRDSSASSDLPCAPGGIGRVEVKYINGPQTDLAGTDIRLRLFSRSENFEWGIRGSYMSLYEIDEYLHPGTRERYGAPAEYVGTFNYSAAVPIPRWKANMWFQQRWFNSDSGNPRIVRLSAHHIPPYLDRRCNQNDDTCQVKSLGFDNPYPKIESMTTADITLSAVTGREQGGRISLSMYNIFDIDPPRATTDLGYDASNHNPFGRMLKLTLQFRLY